MRTTPISQMSTRGLFAVSLIILTSGMAMADTKASPGRIETGQVNWLHNLDEAKELSASADKPILLLFQEIPG